MVKRIVLAACLPAFAPAGTVRAQDWEQIEAHYSHSYQTCTDTGAAAAGDVGALTRCITTETTVQQAALQQAMGQAEARLTPDQVSEMRAAQRRWEGEYSSTCEEESRGLAGANAQRLGRAECELDETIRRVIWAEGYTPQGRSVDQASVS